LLDGFMLAIVIGFFATWAIRDIFPLLT